MRHSHAEPERIMLNCLITRRTASRGVAGIAAAIALRVGPVRAADKLVKVGLDLPFTGALAETARLISYGVTMAFDEINANGGVNGYNVVLIPYDDGTATTGQYDPAQAATNARKMVSDRDIVAAIGPLNSGSGKAMAPILSQGGLATITPGSTNPDLTDPKFATQYRPAGKTIYFRTVATDNYQGPYMANYYADVLHVKTVYLLDDSGAYGVGIADTFQRQADKKGIKIIGRDRLDPKAADYSAVLTKIKSLSPEAIYYGGDMLAGVKLAKQSYDIVPKIIKGGGDGVKTVEMLTAVGYPANEGWYATTASPHLTDDPRMASWVGSFKAKYNANPGEYSVTAFDAALVIAAAIRKVTDGGAAPTREAVRDAIQSVKVDTLQGPLSFDANGDLEDKTISVFQVRQDRSIPAGDPRQFHYIGVAPAT